jgi:type IX secretion system PorP/SprF family membrane protein
MIPGRRFLPVLISLFVSSFYVAVGQQVPFFPVSYRIFDPYILNPAVAGSKDFSSADFIASWNGKLNSQILGFNSRLLKKGPSYFTSPGFREFSNVGVGGYLFRENDDTTHNLGIGAGFSFQIPMNDKALSFLSFGIMAKGVINYIDSVSVEDPYRRKTMEHSFYPNVDVGIYYYGPTLYAGISATNIMGNINDTLGISFSQIPFYFTAGYKFLLSRPYNIVLEPSFIININRKGIQKDVNLIEPVVKLYMQDFCLGTYLNNYDNVSFFLQYKYPRFYLGAYFEVPGNSAYFKKKLNIEVAAGFNFSRIKSRYHKYYHW